ncbi:dTTP/UTP pyrophosphatase [Geodia barretti]|uniref:tRNA (uracil(54)-C(5))-methyltransferase n=1 Tax=Geodia barretti TaxID=519541 RepID=A0AA35TR65_GEOBA|nr:dTTP/UTP pyrophosphatase [Geodia barretti]
MRVGGLFADAEDAPVAQTLPSPNRYGYRNHARLTVNRQGSLGFVNRETRQFVRIEHCMLMRPSVNKVLEELQDRCRETTQLSIRAGSDEDESPEGYLVQPQLFNSEVSITTGQKRYVETVGTGRFFVSSPSFFQVNVEQAAQAAEVVREGLELGPADVLLDAFTGVGTFAVLLAPYVSRVLAVEESSAAVADARKNAAVAYVSCDAETLARDLKILCAGGYVLDRVIPIDMFPQTHHVECVALLRWNGPAATDSLVLASASPRRRELLDALGLNFSVLPADVPEDPIPGETPQQMVERLSLDKALKVASKMESGFVVGGDSTVVHLGESLGKPADDDEARAMLRRLRGTTHHVSTGLTVVNTATGDSRTASMTSEISLRNFSDAEIEASIATGTPRDKAGAYAVQDTELRPASGWEGCYHNIIGLPTCLLLQLLGELGYRWPDDWELPEAGRCGPGCPSGTEAEASP